MSPQAASDIGIIKVQRPCFRALRRVIDPQPDVIGGSPQRVDTCRRLDAGKRTSSASASGGNLPFRPKAFWLGAIGNAAKVNGGWGWMRVKIEHKGGVLTWKVDDNAFVTRPLGATTSGSVMLGHMDLYNSVNNKLTYSIFDNVMVTVP